MAKTTQKPQKSQRTVAQLAQKLETLETTVDDMKATLTVLQRRYRRRGEVLVKIARTLVMDQQLHTIMEVMEREMVEAKARAQLP